MNPILYKSNETDFSHNGIGVLKDATSCVVTEERNGAFEVVMKYPIDGQHYDKITETSVIKVKANETSKPQLFLLYKSTKPIDGIVTWYGEHISYLLNGNPVKEAICKNVNAQGAINKLLSSATFAHDFSGWSDISTVNNFDVSKPASMRACLGGMTDSVLDVWGGEYEFDNFEIKLHHRRGEDTNVVIEYGKNLTDINQEKNLTDVYTAIYPFVKYTTRDESGEENSRIVTLPEGVIPASSTSVMANSKALIMDFSSEFKSSETVTADELRKVANAYLIRNPIDVPKVNITASFVNLWQTEEYKNIAPLEQVKLCDKVKIRFVKLGVDATAKVIKTTYDVLKEKYVSVEIGEAKSTFTSTVSSQINTLQKDYGKLPEFIQSAILTQTELITGQKGGYVVLNPSERPSEILILDKPDIETAKGVWRWNNAGLGYSSNGYNGPYELAMTIDGKINASMITTGTLRGVKIISQDAELSGVFEVSPSGSPTRMMMRDSRESLNFIKTLILAGESGDIEWSDTIGASLDYLSNGKMVGTMCYGTLAGYDNFGILALGASGALAFYLGFGMKAKSMSFRVNDNNNLATYVNGVAKSEYTDRGMSIIGETTTDDIAFNSVEEIKTNITEVKDRAVDIIKQSKVYNYDLKSDKAPKKRVKTKGKRFGFVIGREVPEELLANGKESISLYNTVALLTKAVQEQAEEIEGLKSRIERLEGDKNG